MAPPARTITVALDMSKAFDTINIHTLIRKLLPTNIPGAIIKFIANYIKGRKAYTTYRNHTSKQRQFKTAIQTENTTSITSLRKHTTYFNTPRLKNTIFNNGRYTTNIPTDPHTVTTTNIKTNMRHIHTSIVSRHLATRGNNKILRTPPPHTSSSEEILPRLTRTLAQLRTNKSPFLKSYLHKVDAKTHPSPLCPLCNIHTHDTHHLFNCTHIRTTLSPLDLWTDPALVTALLARWTEKLAGGPQAGTSDSPH